MDIAVIGGGPSGLSAAVNAKIRGCDVTVFTNHYQEHFLFQTQKIDNYLGFPGVTGQELMEHFYRHLEALEIPVLNGRVLNVMGAGRELFINLSNDIYQAKAVVMAVGASAQKTMEGEEAFLGAGVSYCATCDGGLYQGRRVLVLGLSAAAQEEADFLRQIGCRVTYLEPKDTSRFSIRKYEGEMLLVTPQRTYAADCIFILRSVIAPSSLCPELQMENQFIRVDGDYRTSVEGIFACGDCVGLPLQISKACGEGLVAGQNCARYVAKLKKLG